MTETNALLRDPWEIWFVNWERLLQQANTFDLLAANYKGAAKLYVHPEHKYLLNQMSDQAADARDAVVNLSNTIGCFAESIRTVLEETDEP